MILGPLRNLTFELTAAKTTNDFELTVDYVDWNSSGAQTLPATAVSVSNGSNEVVLLAAPILNPIREPRMISAFNADTADKTAIIKTDDGTTETTEIRILVPTTKTLKWTLATDWYITS